eukprot:COSAG03_NODE_679_length_6346_cov_11.418601_6_plen_324_part_00
MIQDVTLLFVDSYCSSKTCARLQPCMSSRKRCSSLIPCTAGSMASSNMSGRRETIVDIDVVVCFRARFAALAASMFAAVVLAVDVMNGAWRSSTSSRAWRSSTSSRDTHGSMSTSPSSSISGGCVGALTASAAAVRRGVCVDPGPPVWGAARRRRARRHAVSQWPRLQFTLIAIMWYRSCRILKKCDDFLKKQKGSAKRPDLPAEPCEPQPAGGPAAVPLPRGCRAPPARKTILKKSEYSNGLAVGGATVGVRSFEQRTSLASSQTPRFRFNQALAGWLEAGWRADAVCVRRPPHVNSSNSFSYVLYQMQISSEQHQCIHSFQ